MGGVEGPSTVKSPTVSNQQAGDLRRPTDQRSLGALGIPGALGGASRGSLGVQEDALPRSLLFLGYPRGLPRGVEGGLSKTLPLLLGSLRVSWGVFWGEASGGSRGHPSLLLLSLGFSGGMEGGLGRGNPRLPNPASVLPPVREGGHHLFSGAFWYYHI